MKSLGKDWFLEPAIDFELKKYTLLAWLQNVENRLEEKKLFPCLSDLQKHFTELNRFSKERDKILYGSRKEITGLDFSSGNLIYEPFQSSSNTFNELNRIVIYSGNKIKEQLTQAELLSDQWMSSLNIVPIGIEPHYKKEGYFFVPSGKFVSVYSYNAFTFSREESGNAFYMNTEKLFSYESTLDSTYERVRLELHKEYARFDIPATYLIECNVELPETETLLPLGERRLLSYLFS